MTRLRQATPEDLKVNDKFCMEGEDTPYLLVIQELHKLIEESSPLNKLESIGMEGPTLLWYNSGLIYSIHDS